MYNAPKILDQRQFDALQKAIRASGYNMEFKPTKYVRGWPQASLRPYLLQHGDGSHIAAFSTIGKLELNWRGRCAC